MEWMDPILTIITRTLGAYIVIFFILRIMGKREIGEVGVFDLVIFLMLAEMAVISIENLDKGFFFSIIPMLLLLLIQRFTAHLSLKSQKAREILDGTSSILIEKGKINEREMRRQRYNIDDLLEQLHENGIQLVQDVEIAILEPTGKLSIFEKKNKPLDIFDPIIADGVIQQKTLQKMGKDENWLVEELAKQGYHDIKSIFYCSLNNDGSLYVDLNNTIQT